MPQSPESIQPDLTLRRLAETECPLCGSNIRCLYDLPHTAIARCQSAKCGLAFALRQPGDKELLGLYNTLYYLDSREGAQKTLKPNSDKVKFRQHFAFLDQRLGLSGRRVLDYGCGIGNFMEIAHEHSAEVVGIEFNDRARNVARDKGLRVEKSLDRLTGERFDFVYMNDVIEHLRDPVTTLREIGQILVPGGALFVVTMNRKGLKALLLGSRWDLITDPTHFYFFDRTSLRQTLISAGFASVEEARFVVNFSEHGFLRRILQYFLIHTGLDTGLKIIACEYHPAEDTLAIADAEAPQALHAHPPPP